jgi:molybdopterin/thiamine biosynthesis adenylyltransferase
MSSPFVIDEHDRYSRLQLISWWDQKKLTDATVMVVGAGALGNEVLKNLALIGVGNITIIDFDLIEGSNLTRSVLFRAKDQGRPKADVAAEAVVDINPDVKVKSIHADVTQDIGLGLVRQTDVVIGCLDNREARLWLNRMCWKVNTPWIDGGIQEINGVAKVFVPHRGPCYECGMTENDYRLAQLRYSCPLLSRDEILAGRTPTAPTIASIIGGLQVQEALKLLHDMPVAEGSALVFNGVANQFYQTKYPFREDCLSHELYEPIEPIELSNRASIKEVFEVLGMSDEYTLELDRDFLIQMVCDNCELTVSFNRPIATVRNAQAICDSCKNMMRTETTHRVDSNSTLASMPLKQLGIPDHDVIKIFSDQGTRYIQLGS